MTDLGIGLIWAGAMARTFAECRARYTQGGCLRAVAGGSRARATAAVEIAEAANRSSQAGEAIALPLHEVRA